MAAPVLFGLKNCDTVKKACNWLASADITYTFHDFRKDGLSKTQLNSWLKSIGWESLLNRRSRTWRELDNSKKENIDQNKAIQLMLDNPSLIKRPVLVWRNQVITGFDPESYNVFFSHD